MLKVNGLITAAEIETLKHLNSYNSSLGPLLNKTQKTKSVRKCLFLFLIVIGMNVWLNKYTFYIHLTEIYIPSAEIDFFLKIYFYKPKK